MSELGSDLWEGRHWDRLVWDLTEFAKARALPTGVSKFDHPQQASPFVSFFRELQRSFPERFWRHQTSNTALTEAIPRLLAENLSARSRHAKLRSLSRRRSRVNLPRTNDAFG